MPKAYDVRIDYQQVRQWSLLTHQILHYTAHVPEFVGIVGMGNQEPFLVSEAPGFHRLASKPVRFTKPAALGMRDKLVYFYYLQHFWVLGTSFIHSGRLYIEPFLSRLSYYYSLLQLELCCYQCNKELEINKTNGATTGILLGNVSS